MEDDAADFTAQFERGIGEFNDGHYYACHDTLEEIWLQESSDQQPFLQGIIQAAVGFFHYEEGRWGAARAMLRLSIDKLKPYPASHEGIHLKPFFDALLEWESALSEGVRTGNRDSISFEFPKIDWVDDERSGLAQP